MNALIRWGDRSSGHSCSRRAGTSQGRHAHGLPRCDALTNYESEARSGRPDALYSLGLAYSTGQGVGVDYVAAHKWFNLAAMKGVDEARAWRAQLSREMSAVQIAEAQRQAREWLLKH